MRRNLCVIRNIHLVVIQDVPTIPAREIHLHEPSSPEFKYVSDNDEGSDSEESHLDSMYRPEYFSWSFDNQTFQVPRTYTIDSDRGLGIIIKF